MKANKLLILIWLSFQVQSILTQSISVELSITWETGYDIFEKDSIIPIPKLHITYRNLSDTDYYFLEISDSRNQLPDISFCGILSHPFDIEEYMIWRKDYYRRAKSHQNYANKNFHVLIEGRPRYRNDWNVYCDSIYVNLDEYEEIGGEVIACNINDIHTYILHSENSESISQEHRYYSPSDTIQENILETVRERLVFLKSKESYIDTYNLIGFKIVQGCFTFKITQERFGNYVLIESIRDNDKTLPDQKVELPAKAGDFTLYSGDFHTNSITVFF